MKGNFSIKNLIIIIGLLQVIYSENEFIKIKAPFKPFVSVLSPESMAQFEDTSKYFQENKVNLFPKIKTFSNDKKIHFKIKK